jgi:putative protein-disulfide isomerase
MKIKENQKRKAEAQNDLGHKEPVRIVQIKYYTDPLCCWSWAFEKNWARLRKDRGQYFLFDYVLCGMLKTWQNFSDPLNAVSNPIQMGPVWMHASQVTQTPIDYSVWHSDPPSSSYPACIAVKCAALQSAVAEDLYLKKVREALMTRALNVSKTSVLLTLAKEVNDEAPHIFDYDVFVEDLNAGKGKDAFRKDIQLAAFHSIARFPTLTFTDGSGKGLILTGYRPYEQLLKVFDYFLENN